MTAPSIITPRLTLRPLDPDDAAFVLALVNEPAWIANIGDKAVRTMEDAGRYIRTGPMRMYAERGFGLYLVQRKDTASPVGMCGLIKRDLLVDVDLGFALLERYWGHGYAHEAAAAWLDQAREPLGLGRVVAIVVESNERSIRLLMKLGFRFEKRIRLEPQGEQLALYGAALAR